MPPVVFIMLDGVRPDALTPANCPTLISLPAIVHSDHGGHDRSHGTESDEDMIIPWMAVGPNIKKSYTIQSQVSLLDTAPTIAKILGLPPHREWEGHSVDEIFE